VQLGLLATSNLVTTRPRSLPTVADEQMLTDLPVRQAVGSQASDLLLAHAQGVSGAAVVRPPPDRLAGGGQFARRPVGECNRSDLVEYLASAAVPRPDAAGRLLAEPHCSELTACRLHCSRARNCSHHLPRQHHVGR
jgi:hypothetical protein